MFDWSLLVESFNLKPTFAWSEILYIYYLFRINDNKVSCRALWSWPAGNYIENKSSVATKDQKVIFLAQCVKKAKFSCICQDGSASLSPYTEAGKKNSVTAKSSFRKNWSHAREVGGRKLIVRIRLHILFVSRLARDQPTDLTANLVWQLCSQTDWELGLFLLCNIMIVTIIIMSFFFCWISSVCVCNSQISLYHKCVKDV